MNMQKRYIIDNDTKALADMYRLGVRVALKMINKFAGSNRHLQSLARMERSEKAHSASSYIIEQYLKRPTFYIKKATRHTFINGCSMNFFIIGKSTQRLSTAI
ncbi:hypothetical protein [Treponema sp. OMZ 838]|uniref:hypothetical protein n=1 Tax=Treponema sp. OMZ 838 TaxID=1539298 RepID=UPI001C0705CF|nr:hypothetical protein [Treponema sp. OMZ 838]